MKFKIAHTNFNVMDMERSLAFYKEALNLTENRRVEAEDGSFILAFIGEDSTHHEIELTYLRDRKEPYDLSDNEIHLAFLVEDIDAARKHHEKMGCICFENKERGIYFIEDPDGYWFEIVPERR